MRWFGFLRGVNLGKRTMKMDKLARELTALGLDDASTFIASGNCSFEAPPADAAKLERTHRGAPREGVRLRGRDVRPHRRAAAQDRAHRPVPRRGPRRRHALRRSSFARHRARAVRTKVKALSNDTDRLDDPRRGAVAPDPRQDHGLDDPRQGARLADRHDDDAQHQHHQAHRRQVRPLVRRRAERIAGVPDAVTAELANVVGALPGGGEARPGQAQMVDRGPRRRHRRPPPGRPGRHRDRQDARLPRAGGALRQARRRRHRDQGAPGPAGDQGPAVPPSAPRPAVHVGGAQGSQQLRVRAAHGRERAAATPSSGSTASRSVRRPRSWR